MRILLVALIGSTVALQPALFGRRASLDVGRGSGEILIADLNRDGHPDIVTKHLLTARINVFMGDGTGEFRRGPGSIEMDYQPGAIALGDVDADGIPDLAIASRRDPNEGVEVWPGNGTGGFVRGVYRRVGGAMPYYKPSVEIIDTNGDGHMDLVVANGRRRTVHVLAGDGRGTFAAPRAMTLEGEGDGYSFAFGDIDRDGDLDRVSAVSTQFRGNSGTLTIARGAAGGRLTTAASRPIPSPRIELLTDLNADGFLDVVLSHAAPTLTILTNDGRGGFDSRPVSLPLPRETHAVAAGDLDGDGHLDLAAATENSVTIFLRTGAGFTAAPGSPFRAGPGAFRIAIGDLNRDGRADLAASSFEGDLLSLFFGR